MRPFRSNAFAGNLSTEEDKTDGKAAKEIEHMFYAKVTSPETLLKALCVEIQEQWGLWVDKSENNAGSGSNRVRKTITKQIVNGEFDNVNSTTSYVMTTKLKRNDGSALEIAFQSSEDGLKAFRLLADSGMIKHRYRFPVPGTELTWEVDMMPIQGESLMSTKYIGWAKIDLELKNFNDPIPAFPDGFTDAFNVKDKNLTPEQLEIVEKMKPYLSLPNPHVKHIYADVV